MRPTQRPLIVAALAVVLGASAVSQALAAPPSAPVNLKARPLSPKQIELSWTNTETDPTRVVIQEFTANQWKPVRTTKVGLQKTVIRGLLADSLHQYRIAARNNKGELSPFTPLEGAITDNFVSPGSCSPSNDTCLQNGRFKLEPFFRAPGGLTFEPGQSESIRPDTGVFWFFHENNVEGMVRVLNGCHITGAYWIFASGLTDVEYKITVTDTEAGRVRSYYNPAGKFSAPIIDTEAFKTCD